MSHGVIPGRDVGGTLMPRGGGDFLPRDPLNSSLGTLERSGRDVTPLAIPQFITGHWSETLRKQIKRIEDKTFSLSFLNDQKTKLNKTLIAENTHNKCEKVQYACAFQHILTTEFFYNYYHTPERDNHSLLILAWWQHMISKLKFC